jgi:hypothetical protein
MIAAGALAGLCGACVLPAAFGEHRDVTLLGLGMCFLSLGALSAAAGIYWKARLLRSNIPASAVEGEAKSRRVRGGCQLCGTETPVIQCRVHQLQLCPTCLAAHYDFRSCAYVPTTRKANKSAKGVAAKRGA